MPVLHTAIGKINASDNYSNKKSDIFDASKK